MFTFIHSSVTGMYTRTVPNKHSRQCNIMWLCHNRLFMWISGCLRQKICCSQAQCRASQSASASVLDCMNSSQIFRPFSTRGHVIYQMNGSLCWTVELVTVYHATRQVSPQYWFSLQRTVFSSYICIPSGSGMTET